MEVSHGLIEAVVLLALASAGLAATERLRLPSVVGFLVVGAIAGPGALGLVSDPDAVREAAREVLDSHGPVDVLINNAGIVSGRPLLELRDDEIQRTFGVNSLALFWTARAFLPGMIERGRGHVVTLASAAGASPLSAAAMAARSASSSRRALRAFSRPWPMVLPACL